MERFISKCNDEDLPEYQRLRDDPDWQQIEEFVRRDYWHVTSLDAWDSIRADRFINPNGDGKYPKRFGSTTERSFGYRNNYVSLFDFATPTEEQLMRQWGSSWDILVSREHDQILLQLGREFLSSEIVSNSAAWNEDRGQIDGGCIPWVEVWYPKPITTNHVQNVYVIPASSRFEFGPKLQTDDEPEPN